MKSQSLYAAGMTSRHVDLSPLAPGALALGLLRASDAMNNALLARLTNDGWPAITRNQSLVFASLDADGTTHAELARRVGITRQSMQKLVASLVDEGLVELHADTTDARCSLVRLSKKGRRLMTAARRHLTAIERHLEDALGRDIIVLRRALATDWSLLVET
jgi:DNA-binding MarR family transcriptional regulator